MVDSTFAALGRLDGRLVASPAARSWMLWAALEGAVFAARNAGVPITQKALTDWIGGSDIPPRATEGLNDPLSVTVVFFYHLAGLKATRDGLGQSTIGLLARFLDDAGEVGRWGQGDLVLYGPLWRELSTVSDQLTVEPSIDGVARGLSELLATCDAHRGDSGITLGTIDGRTLHLPRAQHQAWLAALMAPALLQRAGLTTHRLPNLVPSLRFASHSPNEIADELHELIARAASQGTRQLGRYEQQLAALRETHSLTRRSRLSEAAELLMIFPSMTTAKLALALGTTVPGAAHLKRQLFQS